MSNDEYLARARRTRSLIAQTYRALRDDQTHTTEILTYVPAHLRRIRVYDVLRRVPKLNRDGSEKVLRDAKVYPLTLMGQLTKEERERIIAHLPPRVKYKD